MAYQEQGPCPVNPVYFITLNMDLQDGQDKQDETPRRRKQREQTRSTIGWVLEVIHEPGIGFGESVLKHRRLLNPRRRNLPPK